MRKALLLLLFLPAVAFCQHKYQVTGIPVLKNGNRLQNPWVGGLNNPVFSPIDLNQDGLMDMFVYDKIAWKALAFINTGSVGNASFTYAPQYDVMFPRDLQDWAVIRDYNHDGIGDIFAVHNNGDIMVYKGTRNGGDLIYNKVTNQIRYTYGVGNQTDRVWTFSDNIPVMEDLDGDGDIDFLASQIGSGTTLNSYINRVANDHLNPDSIVLDLGSDCWGHFIENSADCGVTLAFCKTGDPAPPSNPSGARHQGGALTGLHYRRNSPIVSLLLADIYCNTLKFLDNQGDTSNAVITYADSIFPSYDRSVNLPLFPAPFLIDADNDGRSDLFVAPFASNAYQPGQAEDIKVVQYYHNIADDSLEKFHYMGDSMMTGGIVDVGTESHPVFFDYDGDGLMDIVMGNYGRFQTSGASKAGLALYHNIGNDTMPRFEEVTTDWLGLSSYNVNGLYPAFGDLDGDGDLDMVVGDVTGHVNLFRNTTTGDTASFPSMNAANWFNLYVTQNAAPFIYDVNGDSLPDLIIGSRGNNIRYYWNYGSRSAPKYSPDSVNTFFGHIRVYDYHIGNVPGYATPTIVKENGSLVLYSGSQLGRIFKYAINKDSLRSGSFDLIDSDVLGINPGLRSNVSITDLNHDGFADYLVGNIRGGFMMFSDAHWAGEVFTSIDEPHAIDQTALEVYPNPAKDKLTCHLTTDNTTLLEARMYNVLGEAVAAPVSTDGAQTLTISVDDVAAGAYVLQVRSSSGQIFKHKVIILK